MLLNNLAAELSFLRALAHPNLLRFHFAAAAEPPPAAPGVFLPFDGPCVAMVTEAIRTHLWLLCFPSSHSPSYAPRLLFPSFSKVAREGSLEQRIALAARDAMTTGAAGTFAWPLRVCTLLFPLLLVSLLLCVL